MTATEFRRANAIELYAANVVLTTHGEAIFLIYQDRELVRYTEIMARVLAAELIEIRATTEQNEGGSHIHKYTYTTYSGPFTVEWMPDGE